MSARRTNITISEEIIQFYQELADEMGIARSACMVMALKTYMDQQKSLKIGDVYRLLNDLSEKIEKTQTDEKL